MEYTKDDFDIAVENIDSINEEITLLSTDSIGILFLDKKLEYKRRIKELVAKRESIVINLKNKEVK